MRVAVISDIHGNLEALKQVLKDIAGAGVDTVINLGDLIGYGAEPEEVVTLIRKEGIDSILGNHELALIDTTLQDSFTPVARRALQHSTAFLSERSVLYLKSLKPRLIIDDCLSVHGCPPDSVTTYLNWLNRTELEALMAACSHRLCFVGHTHLLECIVYNGREVRTTRLQRGIRKMEEGRRYIVNVGSVGQPRDGNADAKYVIWDKDRNTVESRFVPYDAAVTAEKILSRGFERRNALRLFLAR